MLAGRTADDFMEMQGEAFRAAPCENFVWRLKGGERRSATRHDNLEILAGLGRMRD